MNIAVDLRALVGAPISGVTTYLRETLTEFLRIDKKNRYFLWVNSAHAQMLPRLDFHSPRAQLVVTHHSNRLLNARLLAQKKPWLDRLILTAAGRSNMKLDVFWLPDPRPVALSPNCKLVTTIHDLSAELYPQFFSLKTQVWHRLISARKIVERSDRVLAVSEFTSAQLQNFWHIPRGRIRVTPLGVRSDFRRVTDARILARVRRKYRLPKKFVLALGTLEPRKNLLTLVRAFELLKKETDLPHALVLAGSANPRIFSGTQLSGFDSREHILFPGAIAEEDKAALYSLADVFCFPSVYEGFGLPALEALKIGVPLLASDIPTNREVAGSAALRVPPLNVPAWNLALQHLLTDTELRQQLITLGSRRAREFTWRRTAEATLKAFERVSI